ncbi:uncharacterized protein F5Z01DRAFT_667829 [Emericellopsis atlantica]|uniref:CCZ1/INTU/HSP4 first Longin domain-containing protein n=1 Tax=Emericellopsis atlantica TaxID=2614577 RepID=A0A9P8CKD9_9HYPO|nr:uncharacterized protein F5Z01DRAFT_667829 [Emericellopsis atlantica]KAG9249942.1 hypothetical protein F5Z01DRAFT_667829 [Emericellopsis atlantica]
MTAAPPAAGSVEPAQLGFLAIFNPSLSVSDDTLDDQIVYYASVNTQTDRKRQRRRTRGGKPTEGLSPEERNERLRQIGLAQGMASFSRGFADGAAVDTVDMDKSRVLLHELEPGWWILASIDLTKIPLPPRLPTKTGDGQEEKFEYSSRELKPASLMLADLLRAHNIFLMHHDSSLSALFVRSRRSKFVTVLSRYWDLYLSTWNVMLHGNPARNSYGGINVAPCGELGVGVGEEDRGSSEREVLEGLVGRIEGLVDLVVSRFGECDPDAEVATSIDETHSHWLGAGHEPGHEDGAIFLGTGALSRKSVRDVTHWMEDLYTWGEHAYGLIESPTSVRRAKPSKPKAQAQAQAATPSHDEEPSQPAPVKTQGDADSQPANEDESEQSKLDKMYSYMKMGYGTYWSLPGASGPSSDTEAKDTAQPAATEHHQSLKPERPSLGRRSSSSEAAGHFLIGLKGDIEEGNSDHGSHSSEDGGENHNSRTVLRTINVELESETTEQPEATIIKNFQHPASVHTQSQVVGNMVPGYNSHDLNKAAKLRVVLYVNRPFVFAFFFRLRTDSLAMDTLYRSLHHQLAPLKKQLLASTEYRPSRPDSGRQASEIHDLIWDPQSMTVRSTIPNIPETNDPPDQWSRADALSTHLHLLNIQAATRHQACELERTQKTSRGWWIVWTRIYDEAKAGDATDLQTIHEGTSDAESQLSRQNDDREATIGKEIILIRRASDHIGFRKESVGGEGAGRLAQGIGVDTRRYIEELLSLL